MKATSVEKWAVRLEGLPWKWVRADRLGLKPAALRVFFTALSKDAPDVMALAVEEEDGYRFVNVDASRVRPVSASELYLPGRGTWPLNELYLPLGFAQDVEEWLAQFGKAKEVAWTITWATNTHRLPVGEWVDFCDLARTMDEGGDQDRYFAAHFVRPMWWVVPFPE